MLTFKFVVTPSPVPDWHCSLLLVVRLGQDSELAPPAGRSRHYHWMGFYFQLRLGGTVPLAVLVAPSVSGCSNRETRTAGGGGRRPRQRRVYFRVVLSTWTTGLGGTGAAISINPKRRTR